MNVCAQRNISSKNGVNVVRGPPITILRRLPQRKAKMDVLARWARERWLKQVKKDVSKDIRERKKKWLAQSMARIETIYSLEFVTII